MSGNFLTYDHQLEKGDHKFYNIFILFLRATITHDPQSKYYVCNSLIKIHTFLKIINKEIK